MSKLSRVYVNATVAGEGVEFEYRPSVVTNSSAPSGGPQALTLSNGNNTVTPPTGATGCILGPGTAGKTLKGASGDTGIALSVTGPTTLFLASASAFVINSSGGETISIFWF